MPQTPGLTSFPVNIRDNLLITPPTSTPNQPPRSLLIFLHGLGDTHAPFSNLGRQLNLPHTACISIRGPSPLPAIFMGTDTQGWHWGDDVVLDDRTGVVDMEGAGFEAAGKLVASVLEVALGKDGFESRDVFFLGFGQGGMVALSLAEAFGERDLGGMISIGAGLPSSKLAMGKVKEALNLPPSQGKARTPVLLCGGNRGTAVTAAVLSEVKARFETVQYVKWQREGDGMMRSREEVLPVMKFLASRLRMPAPQGTEEVGSAAMR